MAKQWRDFESARKFVHELKLKNNAEWRAYTKSGNKPDDIPITPEKVYKNDFNGYGDFLGSGTIAPQNRVYRPFTKAREFVRSLGLKNQKEWIEYCMSGNKPDDIPTNPNATYKNDFKGYGDFLGTDRIQPQQIQYRSFTDAREFVRSLKLENYTEWQEYCKSGNKPDDIPSNFPLVYKNKDWVSWSDVLNTGTVATQNRVYRSFTDAREFVRSLKLKSGTEWEEYCKSGNKPKDIPYAPSHTYKNKGWKGLGDWTGSGTVATQNRVYRSFTDAREFVRNLRLKNHREWQEYCKSGEKPDDIPTNPWDVYKEWKK
jgi:hypothetical protein